MNLIKTFISTLFVKDYESSKIYKLTFNDININSISGELLLNKLMHLKNENN